MIRNEPCTACGERPARQPSGLCVRCYKRKWATGSTTPSTRTKPGEPQRFFDENVGRETDDCIVWPFGKDKDGYGVLPPNRRVHQVACELHGPKPHPKMEAAHSCHNPSCFNPRHLSWKTRLKNEQEKTAAGRRPEAWNRMTFTAEEIADMKSGSVRAAAMRHKISRNVVDRIRRENP